MSLGGPAGSSVPWEDILGPMDSLLFFPFDSRYPRLFFLFFNDDSNFIHTFQLQFYVGRFNYIMRQVVFFHLHVKANVDNFSVTQNSHRSSNSSFSSVYLRSISIDICVFTDSLPRLHVLLPIRVRSIRDRQIHTFYSVKNQFLTNFRSIYVFIPTYIHIYEIK